MKFRWLIITLLLMIVIPFMSTTVYSLESAFPCKEMDMSSAVEFHKSLNIRVLDKEPNTFKKISRIAIRDDGGFALRTFSTPDIDVYVFDSEGNFQYGFETTCKIRYTIEFDGTNLIIIDTISGEMISIDRDGKLIDYAWIDDTVNSDKVEKEANSIKKTYNGYTYSLENDGLVSNMFSSYKKVTKTDSQGNKTVLFECNNGAENDSFRKSRFDVPVSPSFYIIGIPFVFVLTVLLVVISIYLFRKKYRTKNQRDRSTFSDNTKK